MECPVDITVVVSTRDRARQLERMLGSLQKQHLDGLELQAIVVDNGSHDDTAAVQQRTWSGLSVTALFEPTQGKSRALNKALEFIRGDLIVFTDDDTTATPTWLADLYHASVEFPGFSVFCGPIIPCFPSGTPEWLRTHAHSDAFFGNFQPQTQRGTLPENVLPFGANFAARRTLLNGTKFRLDLGPSLENGPFFCEDIEYIGRLLDRCPGCIFVPNAAVFHHISQYQIDPMWIFERAFHLGRAGFFFHRQPRLTQMQPAAAVNEWRANVELGALINYYCGQLYECRSLCEQCSYADLVKELKSFDTQLHRDLLGPSARRFYTKELAQSLIRNIPA